MSRSLRSRSPLLSVAEALNLDASGSLGLIWHLRRRGRIGWGGSEENFSYIAHGRARLRPTSHSGYLIVLNRTGVVPGHLAAPGRSSTTAQTGRTDITEQGCPELDRTDFRSGRGWR